LLEAVGFNGMVTPGAPSAGQVPVLVIAKGSGSRGEKAPGHLDDRSAAFDSGIEGALSTGDVEALAGIALQLGDQLLACGLYGLRTLAKMGQPISAFVDHATDPFGVRYWVARWEFARQ